MVASAQLRGQPDTAILNLCGVHEPQLIFSSLIPRPVESCVPKRHHSEPTQVFTVRSDLPKAWPETKPARLRSPHMRGRSSFFTPNRSLRCPPVIFTVGTRYLSATSAMARSSAGVVAPPQMRGTTEKLPSFWIFACARSLM